MALSKIKKEFANKRVAFGESAARLGKRSDIDDLAIMAWESGNENLKNLFATLPSLDALKKNRLKQNILKTAPAVRKT